MQRVARLRGMSLRAAVAAAVMFEGVQQCGRETMRHQSTHSHTGCTTARPHRRPTHTTPQHLSLSLSLGYTLLAAEGYCWLVGCWIQQFLHFLFRRKYPLLERGGGWNLPLHTTPALCVFPLLRQQTECVAREGECTHCAPTMSSPFMCILVRIPRHGIYSHNNELAVGTRLLPDL